jgi:light-regulated signal transduction histidine kinase (bacteriophytochrome)
MNSSIPRHNFILSSVLIAAFAGCALLSGGKWSLLFGGFTVMLAYFALRQNRIIRTLAKREAELRASEATYRAMDEELRRSNSELEQFAYAISHDMRQPLRMIASYQQLLEKHLEGKLDDDGRAYLHFATDGAIRLDQMLVALLEYSRIGRKTEPLTWIASREAVDEALLFLKPAIDETAAHIRIDGDWPQLFASQDEMVRLFQNLIGNALKYHKSGQAPEIEVTGRSDRDVWTVWVEDRGIGIEPSQIPRLFQVFQRLQPRTKFEGAGVGLALCRKIVEHHGGRIRAESAGPGQGSRFTIELPLTAPEQPHSPDLPRSTQ